MTLIELMAKAAWNATADEFNQWDQTDAEDHVLAIDGMRAAIFALTKADLPFDVTTAGGQAMKFSGSPDVFRVMLMAMLEENEAVWAEIGALKKRHDEIMAENEVIMRRWREGRLAGP